MSEKNDNLRIESLKESLLHLTDFIEELARTIKEAGIKDIQMFNLITNLNKHRQEIDSI